MIRIVQHLWVFVCIFASVLAQASDETVFEMEDYSTVSTFTSLEGFDSADVRFGLIADAIRDEATDGMGLFFTLEHGQGKRIYLPTVQSGDGPVLIRAKFFVELGNVGAALAALNVPQNGDYAHSDGSLATNQPSIQALKACEWNQLTLIYDPPNNAVVPIFQTYSTADVSQQVILDWVSVVPLGEFDVEELALLVQQPDQAVVETIQNPYDDHIFFDDFSPTMTLNADDDGVLDYLQFEWEAETITANLSVAYGNGDGSYNPEIVSVTSTPDAFFLHPSVNIVDVNRDGLDDIVYNLYGKNSQVFISQNGTYSESVELPFEAEGVYAADDFNGDGIADYVVNLRKAAYPVDSEQYNLYSNLFIYYGVEDPTVSSNQTFTAITLVPDRIRSAKTMDLDADGQLEIALLVDSTTGEKRSIYLLEKNEQGSFSMLKVIGIEPTFTDYLLKDFNHDGFGDLVVAGGSQNVSIALGKQLGDYSLSKQIRVDNKVSRVIAADLNQDGHLDIVASGLLPIYHILFGNGDGSFQEQITLSGGNGLEAIRDVNQDGYADLISDRGISINTFGDGNRVEPSALVHPDSDPEAVDMLNQVLEANLPWLRPKPIEAVYEISWQESGTYHIKGGEMTPLRVGSLYWSGLHHLAHQTSPYKASIVESDDLSAVIEVEWMPPVTGRVQQLGQGNENAAMVGYSITKTKIQVDLQTMLPIRIDEENNSAEFSSPFYEIDGGYAPGVIEFSGTIDQTHEFQVVDGVWILKQAYSDIVHTKLDNLQILKTFP